MSRVSTAIALALVKQATYASTADSRNYTPKRPAQPEVKKEETGLYKYRVERPKQGKNAIIGWGQNKDDDSGYLPLTENRLLDYHNTISGTGHGRPYWAEKENPYEST